MGFGTLANKYTHIQINIHPSIPRQGVPGNGLLGSILFARSQQPLNPLITCCTRTNVSLGYEFTGAPCPGSFATRNQQNQRTRTNIVMHTHEMGRRFLVLYFMCAFFFLLFKLFTCRPFLPGINSFRSHGIFIRNQKCNHAGAMDDDVDGVPRPTSTVSTIHNTLWYGMKWMR